MKKLISILAVMIAALLFSACGQDPVAELETQIAKEDNPNRRELFAEFAQIFRRERAKQPFDATRGLALAVAFDYPDYAEFFLERGADVNGTCMDGAPMLGFAAKQHFSEICRSFSPILRKSVFFIHGSMRRFHCFYLEKLQN